MSAAWNVSGATSQFAVVIVDASTGERTVLWNRHAGLSIAPTQVSREAVTSGLLHEQADGAALAHAVERHPVRLEEHLTPDRRTRVLHSGV